MIALLIAGTAMAQSSSLFLEGEQNAADAVAASQPSGTGAMAAGAGARPPVNSDPADPLNQASFIAVLAPPPRTFQLNDLISIVVIENMQRRSDNQNQQSREVEFEWMLEQWFRISGGNWLQQDFGGGTPEIDMSFDDSRTGNVRSNRRDSLRTRITARIIDVKPNGTLLLEASRTIIYDEDEQVVTLTGYCRSEDVTGDNSVLSTQMHDLKLYTNNTGQVRDGWRRGWLLKVLDYIRPL
ncbi:MAG: flagellar basal body L-ring protein FlgH [Phycisphaerae bacterium]